MSALRPKILIVDHDQLLGEFYACLLSLQGFVPVWTANGEEARRAIESQTNGGFSLAVIDLLPPTEEYWSLIRHLQENPATAKVPIITITGISLSYEELERIKGSCSAVLLKGSFELSRFKDTVAQFCRA